MVSIYDGQQCVGFVLARGRQGFEAFDVSERSLGVFASQQDAANALAASTNKHEQMAE
jgi:hypothetical protein